MVSFHALASVPTPPEATSLWEYAVLLFFTGGGSVAIHKLLTAWKEWSTTRRANDRQAKLDDQSVIDNVINILKQQIEDQMEDFTERLEHQEQFYKSEMENRKALYIENTNHLKEQIASLGEELSMLRRENTALKIKMQKYEAIVGFIDDKSFGTNGLPGNINSRTDGTVD